MDKNHNCLNQLREDLLKANPEVTTIIFDHSNIINTKDRTIPPKTGQGITIEYIHTDKKGVKKARTRKTFVSHDYCPFCGKKYL